MYQIQNFIEISWKNIITTDAWTDPNQTSFMAVTAHWIEAVEEKVSSGSQKKL